MRPVKLWQEGGGGGGGREELRSGRVARLARSSGWKARYIGC